MPLARSPAQHGKEIPDDEQNEARSCGAAIAPSRARGPGREQGAPPQQCFLGLQLCARGLRLERRAISLQPRTRLIPSHTSPERRQMLGEHGQRQPRLGSVLSRLARVRSVSLRSHTPWMRSWVCRLRVHPLGPVCCLLCARIGVDAADLLDRSLECRSPPATRSQC